MSLLTIAQQIAVKFGLPQPNTAASSPDQNIVQIVAYINEAGQEVSAAHPWQALQNEGSFVTVASADQGLITSMTGVGQGFAFITNDTMWDRTTRRPLFGPRSSPEWQMMLAQFVQGPWYQYRVRGNHLLINPVPPVGDSVFFEWHSQYWATDLTGVTGKTAMDNDTDVSLISERLIRLDAIWRYKEAKGLDYETDFDKAQAAIMDSQAHDASKPTLNLSGMQQNVYPGVIVPAGNWGVP